MSSKKYFKLVYVSILTRLPEKDLIGLASVGTIDNVVENGHIMLEGGSLVDYLKSTGREVPEVLMVTDKKVLIVDDDPLVINSLKRLLIRYEGVMVQSASDAFEMGRILSSDNLPDLVILDYNMPGINGLEILKHLKKASDTANTRVIIYSGNMPEDVRREMLELKADKVIQKSGDAGELISALTSIFNEKKH